MLEFLKNRRVQSGFLAAVSIIAVLVFFAEIAVLVLYRETWADEVFSSFKSYLLLKGSFTPFVESNFEYSPLVIFTFGLVQYFFGPNLYAGRILSVVFLILATGIFSYLLKRRAGSWGMVAGWGLLLSNILLMGNYITTTMYALSFLLLMVLILIQEKVVRIVPQVVLSSVVISLLILARINMIAAFIAYLAYLLISKVKIRYAFFSVAIVAVVIVLAYIPIVRANPDLAIATILSPFGNFGPLKELPTSLKVGGQTIFRFIEILSLFVREYFGYLLIGFLSVVAVSYAHMKEKKFGLLLADRAYFLAVTLAVVLLGTHYFYWRIVSNVYYANYFIPVIILVAVLSIAKMTSQRALLWGVVVTVIGLNVLMNIFRTDVISDPRAESDISRVERGAEAVRKNTKPEDTILTFDNSIYHVYLADRRTYFPLMNRDFLFLNSTDTPMVRSIGFYNTEMVKEWLTNDADYLLLHAERWPSSFIRSRFWGTAEGGLMNDIKVLDQTIKNDYELVDTVYNVYPRKYTEGNDGGTLLIYRRIK